MDTKALAISTIKQYGEIVAQVPDDAWPNSTPCADWNLHLLVNHVTGEVFWIPEMLAGKTIAEVGSKYDGDVLKPDPKAAWSKASKAAITALEGLEDAKTPVHLSYGDFPAETYLSHMIIDGVIHAWDTAQGANLDFQLANELVEAGYKLFLKEAASWRQAGILGPEVKVTDDVPTLTKLLGLSGRISA